MFLVLVRSHSGLLSAPPSGSCHLCSFSKAWLLQCSGQQYSAASPVRHTPPNSFSWYPRGQISIKFSLHGTAVTSLPFRKPRPCPLQQGQDLSLGEEYSSWEALSRVLGVLVAPEVCLFYTFLEYFLLANP